MCDETNDPAGLATALPGLCGEMPEINAEPSSVDGGAGAGMGAGSSSPAWLQEQILPG